MHSKPVWKLHHQLWELALWLWQKMLMWLISSPWSTFTPIMLRTTLPRRAGWHPLASFHKEIQRRERERVLGSVPPTQLRNWHWNLSGPTSYLAWLFWKVFVFTPCQLVGSRLLISHSWASFQSHSLHAHSVHASFTEELQAGKYFGVCLSQMQSPICSFCLGL